MKREKMVNRWGEGWLVAAALGLAALIFLLMWMDRLPRSIAVEPVRSVSVEKLIVKVDLNVASAEELAELPGIGEGLAERIVQYREEKGGFSSVEELDDVPGIGEAKIAAIEELVFCG